MLDSAQAPSIDFPVARSLEASLTVRDLSTTTVQHIDELAARIKARGGVLETEPIAVAGQRGFRLRDPDGFRFAISSPRQA